MHSEVKPWPQGSCRWGRGRPDPACVLSRSVVSDFVTPWSHSSVHGILQARVLEWAAISSPGEEKVNSGKRSVKPSALGGRPPRAEMPACRER